MRVANVLVKSFDDRWRSTVIGTSVVALFLALSLAAYQSVDLSLYDDLPDALRAAMNIPVGADPASLGFGVIYNLIAAMTLAGLAISIGASSIAGEERDGTLGLLLASPRSRVDLLTAKVSAMLGLVTLGAVVLLIGALAAPALIGVDMGQAAIPALVIHLWANALLFGSVAVAIGAWTGLRGVASGAAAGLMVLSYFAVGLLPLLEATAELARLFPWYYFDGSAPLTNGVDAGHLAVQLGGAAVLSASSYLGLPRRDLRQPGGGLRGLVDRLRDDPRAAALVDRLGGRARVSTIWLKTASEGQVLLLIVAAYMFSTQGVLMGPMFRAVEGSLTALNDSFPPEILAFVGASDLSTPEGWYVAETFGLMAPIATGLVAIVLGARALAGEERDRTMSLLLANPLPRRRIVLEKAAAMAVHGAVIGVAIFAGVTAGSLIANLGIPVGNIAAASIGVTLLGLVFGSVALAIGAATGRVRSALLGATGIGVAAYVANALLTISGELERWAVLSPFHWYLGADPLVRGLDLWATVGFLALIALFVAGAAVLFERRDVRSG